MLEDRVDGTGGAAAGLFSIGTRSVVPRGRSASLRPGRHRFPRLTGC